MLKESGLLQSFSECQTALPALPASSGFLQVFPSVIPAQEWAGLWMQFLRSTQCFIRTPGTPDHKPCPQFVHRRWPNLAELIQCPFSIITNSLLLSLGRSTSDPQKGCGSAWRAAQQPGEEPCLIARDHSR